MVTSGEATQKLEVQRRSGELREQPAIGQLIVEHHRIAGIFRLAGAAKTRPECIVRDRTKDRSPGLVKDLEMNVVHDDDMVGPDVAVGIRWRATARKSGEAVEGDDGARYLYSNGANQPLHTGS